MSPITGKKMDVLNRNTYLDILEEIRNTERISIDEYIDQRLIPLQKEHPAFVKILYKDISYVLDGIDKDSDNDLEVKDGDFVIEDGDFKLTGYQTRLHDILIWLHMEVSKEMVEKFTDPEVYLRRMEEFENGDLKRMTYKPEYRAKLEDIRNSIKAERSHNYMGVKEKETNKVWYGDFLELKPNFFGLGINFNAIINRLWKRKK